VKINQASLTLTRHGIHDRDYDQSNPDQYLRDLRQRFASEAARGRALE
jgi:hypothetical protein